IEEASPYLNEGDVRFEPKTALTSGVDGLHDIKQIISTSPMFLNKGGLLAFEHGFNQGRAVRDLLLAAGFSSVSTVKDYGENDRVTFGVWL
ncbi:MAG: protein-(glutamine-N5) methyltransferase, release factor-specific, partial [Pseudomonadota bacterium]|nr:protein-(glutamine-N5) methyltransferase, release factor-specific [Pseudomonadota bacterium]